MRVETNQRVRRLHEIRRVVEHHHRARAQHRTGLGDRVEVVAEIEVFLEETRRGTAARLDAEERPALTQPARAIVDQLANRHAQRHLVISRLLDVARDRNDLEARRAYGTRLREPLRAVAQDVRQIGQRLDVVYDRRFTIESLDRRKRRLEARFAALALERVEQSRLFTADIRTGAALDREFEIVIAAADPFADVPGVAGLLHGIAHDLEAGLELAANIDERVMAADGVRTEQDALDDLVRRLFEQHVVFERARFGLIAVANEVARTAVVGQKRPLATGWKARAATSAQARSGRGFHDRRGAQRLDRAFELHVPTGGTVHLDVAQVQLADARCEHRDNRARHLVVSSAAGRGPQLRFVREPFVRTRGNRRIVDDPIEHNDAAAVADAAGIVGVRNAHAAGRFTAGLRFDLPGTRGRFGLRARLDVVGAGAHRKKHVVDHFRREVVLEAQVHLHARRAVAGGETFDFLIRKEAVVGRLEMADAELLAKVGHDLLGAVEDAREIAANLEHVAPDRPAIEQRVERDRRLDDRERQLEQVGDRRERVGRCVAFALLEEMRHWDQRAARILVQPDQRFALRPQFGEQLIEVVARPRNVRIPGRHELGAALGGAHRSTSPKTGSSEPIITTISAMYSPTAIFLRTCRLYIDGGRVRTRHGRLSPLETM